MSSQHHNSCDRCRQQKIRCLKDWGVRTNAGNDDHLGPCERCAKANAPCVYSLRQRSRRVSNRPKRNSDGYIHLNEDLTTVLSRSGVSDTDLGHLSIQMLNAVPNFDDSIFHDWDKNNTQNITAMSLDSSVTSNDHTNNGDCHVGSDHSLDVDSVLAQDRDSLSGDGMIAQLIAVSTRATRATSSLEQSRGGCAFLTVNSPAVNEAFETANVLVRIINSIPPADLALVSVQLTPLEDFESPKADYGLIFMAFASHQHVLALFKAICDSIQQYIMSNNSNNEQDQLILGSDGASSAQFVMVLQLVMHMTNRMGRSMRLRNQNSIDMNAHDQINNVNPAALTFGCEGRKGNCGSEGIVDAAQAILRKLPDEHVKLKQVIRGLQTFIEEQLHM